MNKVGTFGNKHYGNIGEDSDEDDN